MRGRAIWCALWYGVRPSWMYEDSPHYAPMSYLEHLVMNLGVVWRWGTFRETAEDRAFEAEVNGSKEGKTMFKKLWRAGLDKLSAAVDNLQAAWPVEKVVKALGPVFSIVAGAAAAWTADHFPGLPPIEQAWLAGIFAIAAAGTLGLINKVIDGWQRREAREHEAEEAEKQRASEERIAALHTRPTDLGALGEAQDAAAKKVVADVAAAAPAGVTEPGDTPSVTTASA